MRLVEWILEGLIAVIVGVFCLLTIAQVIARYGFNSPFTWSEETGRYLFIWAMMLATALGVRRKVHIGFDLFLNWLKGTKKRWMEFVNYVVIMIFAVLVFVFGIVLFLSVKNTVTGGLGLPLGYVYSAVPVGFFVMILFVAESLWNEIRKKKNPTDLPG